MIRVSFAFWKTHSLQSVRDIRTDLPGILDLKFDREGIRIAAVDKNGGITFWNMADAASKAAYLI